jgi:hypothetical protein
MGTADARKAYIRRSDGVAVPGNTKHSVAAGLDDNFMLAALTRLRRDDIFDL